MCACVGACACVCIYVYVCIYIYGSVLSMIYYSLLVRPGPISFVTSPHYSNACVEAAEPAEFYVSRKEEVTNFITPIK